MSTARHLTPDQNEALSAVRQAAGEVALRQSLTDQAEDDLDLRCAEALESEGRVDAGRAGVGSVPVNASSPGAVHAQEPARPAPRGMTANDRGVGSSVGWPG